MDLFERVTGQPENLLPRQGMVHYYGPIMSLREADQYFESLYSDIDWKNDEAIILGQKIITKRKVAWYGDSPFEYTYSGTTKRALFWTEELIKLKEIVEQKTDQTYNSCLLNLYHNGGEGMAWHSDGEKDLKKNGAIGSLSFGAERKFSFKNKETKETISQVLEKGSLLVMSGVTQTYWTHRLPPTRSINTPRINLTFRSIIYGQR